MKEQMIGWRRGRMKYVDCRINEWMNKWMIEWMNEWVNEWMNEWVNEWVSEWMNEWINKYINKWMKEWMNTYYVIHKCNGNTNNMSYEWMRKHKWTQINATGKHMKTYIVIMNEKYRPIHKCRRCLHNVSDSMHVNLFSMLFVTWGQL